MPEQISTALDPSHELMKAFLFLRTASAALSNIKAQIKSTKSYIQWNSVNGYYNEHWAYEAELEKEHEDLTMWERRYAQAGAGLVNWASKVQTGRWLPAEIVELVRNFLWDDGLDLRKIW
ncbi:hypothetical protein MMC21_003480 [Puttea exsequens]|nr:hypothetical protein [Puttea exsequens]